MISFSKSMGLDLKEVSKQFYAKALIPLKKPDNDFATAFAPSNIALCKYWGKSNLELNLPSTPSLSISLGNRGSEVKISISSHNSLSINGKDVPHESVAFKRTFDFVGLLTTDDVKLSIQSVNNIPTAAGLASSASYFAALTLALDKLHNWQVPLNTLSCLARLGSGSACRSLYQGFVQWVECVDPWQSYGVQLKIQWPDFRIGLLIFDGKEKTISSRQAMLHTQLTSPLYNAWCENSYKDFAIMYEAIEAKNFQKLGETAEYNALSLHAVMLSARPAIIYSQPSTLESIAKVHALRKNGVQVYLTQDAGPNLKLMFLKDDLEVVLNVFTGIEIIEPIWA